MAIATQKAVLNALAFLYNKFLDKPLGNLSLFKRVRKQLNIPTVLFRREVASLMSYTQGAPWLVASLLYGSGLRRIEVVRLRVKDIDFYHLQIQVRNDKRFKRRLMTLTPELAPVLKIQIDRVSVLPTRNLRRHHIDESGIYRSIKTAADRTNIRKQVTSHTMRHSFATDLLESRADITTVQEQLGHTDEKIPETDNHVLNRDALAIKRQLSALNLAG